MGVGLALGVGTLAKGVTGYLSSKSQAKGFKNAAGILQKSQDQAREDLAPYRQRGSQALDQLALALGLPDSQGRMADGRDFSEFFKSPGYQFRLDEGIKAVERSGAARGLLQSGGTLKGIQRYGEGLAADEFGRYTNQLFSLAGMGQNAVNTGAQLGANYASNMANMAVGKGQARASGWQSLGNTVIGGLQGLSGLQGFSGGGIANDNIQTAASGNWYQPPPSQVDYSGVDRRFGGLGG